MKYFDLSFPSPGENLACDEALLDAYEDHEGGESLRFWETDAVFVVLGYADRIAQAVNADACRQDGVGIFRRTTGGGAIVQGKGCLNYSLVLDLSRPELQTIPATNCFIMTRHARALSLLDPAAGPVAVAGISDLALGDRKFSGNAQRRKRAGLLFHGTFLLNFDPGTAARYLQSPARQPPYRAGRGHADFLTNFPASPAQVKEAIRLSWNAQPGPAAPPSGRVATLAREKYSRPEWTWRF